MTKANQFQKSLFGFYLTYLVGLIGFGTGNLSGNIKTIKISETENHG